MSVEYWVLYVWLPYAGMALVPLGVLLHFWRRADARPIVGYETQGDAPHEAQKVWGTAGRAQLRRGRIASLIAVGAALLSGPAGLLPGWQYVSEWYGFLVPISAAILGIAVLLVRPAAAAAARTSSGTETLDLSTRSALSFGERWWYGAWALSLSALMVAVVCAGLLSSTDDQGRYAAFTVRFNHETWAATSIAGWHVGVPILCASIVLLGVSVLALVVQARAPLDSGSGRTLDIWLRRSAARTVLALGSGAILTTLSSMLFSIGAASSTTMSVVTTELGSVSMGTSIAALGTPLMVGGYLVQGLGIALLLLPLFTRLAPVVVRERADARLDGGEAVLNEALR